MEVTRMRVGRFQSHKGNEAANRALLVKLNAHKVVEAHWTDHARQRAQEMVNAGFPFEHMMRAIDRPQYAYWSPTHMQPCGRFGEVSVGLLADKWGRAIVVTVLPATDGAWQKFYESGQAKGRERRVEAHRAKGLDRPPELTAQALSEDTEDHKRALYFILDDPLWMPFFLVNKKTIDRLFRQTPGLRTDFHRRLRRIISVEARDETRTERLAADVEAHPHIAPVVKGQLLGMIRHTAKSIYATQGGLPTLGKRR